MFNKIKELYYWNSDEFHYAGAIIVIAFIIWFGYGSTHLKVDSCYTYSTVHMSAEFSETTTGIDYDGKIYIETDYWSEEASIVYFIEMENEKIIASNTDNIFYNGSVALPTNSFPYDESYKNRNNFYKFEIKMNSLIKQYFTNDDKVTIEMSEYKNCLDNVGKVISVNTWYTITY